MHRVFLISFIPLLLSSCFSKENNFNKNKNGAFTCSMTAINKSQSSCEGIQFKHTVPISFGKLESSIEKPESPLHGLVFLINKTSSCGETEDYFPVAIASINSENNSDYIIIGMPCDPEYNPKEITDFFNFQLAHSRSMKSIEKWIEQEYNQEWLVTRWENDKKAKDYIDRLGIKF